MHCSRHLLDTRLLLSHLFSAKMTVCKAGLRHCQWLLSFKIGANIVVLKFVLTFSFQVYRCICKEKSSLQP